jgi:hypothetical protein
MLVRGTSTTSSIECRIFWLDTCGLIRVLPCIRVVPAQSRSPRSTRVVIVGRSHQRVGIMAAGSQIGRCYKVIGALLQGRVLDRRLIAKLINVEPAAADAHIKALLEFVPNVQARRTRHHRTIRLTSDAALGPASRRLAVAACLGASLASLFRGTNYEQLLDQARDSVIGRLRNARDFEDARRKFLFIFQAGEVALPDRQHVFDDLVDAVLEQRRVQIEYTGFEGDERSEEISPWSIAIYDHQLYVLAEGTSSAPRGVPPVPHPRCEDADEDVQVPRPIVV